MKRYSIMVREVQADHETELCQCETNPEASAAAARGKTLSVAGANGRRRKIARYENVRIQDNQQSA